MAGVVFDTNIWIGYKPTKLPNNLVMSAVVLLELVAGASDGAVLKGLEASRKQYEKEDKLLIPTGEDWFRAGKILNSFLHNLKAQSGGKTPRRQPNKIQQTWPAWTLWQYTDGVAGPGPHSVDGIGPCDRDQFNGTVDQLKQLWGMAADAAGGNP